MPENNEYVDCTIEKQYSSEVYLIKFFNKHTNKFVFRAAFRKELTFIPWPPTESTN
jgi:hypothetical protein